jgi:hypothetical protein
VTFIVTHFVALLVAGLSLFYQLNKNEQEKQIIKFPIMQFYLELFNMTGVKILNDDVHTSGRSICHLLQVLVSFHGL